jgi:hypothetical protein
MPGMLFCGSIPYYPGQLNAQSRLVPIHKWLIYPISALSEKFNPWNINHMPAVKFFVRLDLEQIILFLDRRQLCKTGVILNAFG